MSLKETVVDKHQRCPDHNMMQGVVRVADIVAHFCVPRRDCISVADMAQR
jgi:hypothetical protein